MQQHAHCAGLNDRAWGFSKLQHSPQMINCRRESSCSALSALLPDHGRHWGARGSCTEAGPLCFVLRGSAFHTHFYAQTCIRSTQRNHPAETQQTPPQQRKGRVVHRWCTRCFSTAPFFRVVAHSCIPVQQQHNGITTLRSAIHGIAGSRACAAAGRSRCIAAAARRAAWHSAGCGSAGVCSGPQVPGPQDGATRGALPVLPSHWERSCLTGYQHVPGAQAQGGGGAQVERRGRGPGTPG